MSGDAKVFGDLTHWDPIQTVGFAMGWDRGWRPNGQSWNIGKDDPYWGQVLERARHAYGDPNIRYNTDDRYQPRQLVFGDGTALPADGTIVYHDAASGQNWIQNGDGTVTPANKDYTAAGEPFRPQYRPRPDGGFAPVDAEGRQVGPVADQRPAATPVDVDVPAGMVTPAYPHWATETDPDIPRQLTGVFARLYELFGSGTPARSQLPDFPFSTNTGQGSGIESYDTVRGDFKRIESEFETAAQAFKKAVDASANVTEKGRDAINTAIGTFNSTAATLAEGDWGGLLRAESTALETVTSSVRTAAATTHDVPTNPSGGPSGPAEAGTPLPPGVDPIAAAPAAPPTTGKTEGLDDLLSKLDGAGSPFGGMPMGGNPLGGLGAMNPLGGGGLGGASPMGGAGGGAKPLAPLADAIKPLADPETDKADEKKPTSITPLNSGPQNTPPPASSAGSAGGGGEPATAPAGTTVMPAGTATTKPTVTLPDGKVIDAPNKQAADAAQNALDKASPGGDAAQKSYSPTGLELPGDGKNLGAKVDPSDMQPGDVLKWQDKTMVAVAPGLVADPNHPGVTHTLDEVMKDQKGFEGVFRPTATDPTLSVYATAPPVLDPHPAAPPADHPAPQNPSQPPAPVPAEPPPNSIELSGPAPAATAPQTAPEAPQRADPPVPSATVPQAAPPSPFETPNPPAATRTTRAQRVAAGTDLNE